MSRKEPAVVVGKDGLRGTIEAEAHSREAGQVVVRLGDGLRLAIPEGTLTARDDGTYYLPLGPGDIERIRGGRDRGAEAVVPIIVEDIDVETRTVETGRVRVTKVVHEREEVVDEPLYREELDVERVAVNRVVEGPVPVRQEGDVTIVPVLEEVLVVEKRLMLKEELRITRRRVEEHKPQRVALRAEEVTAERIDPRGRRGG